jgi:hypothetical protein
MRNDPVSEFKYTPSQSLNQQQLLTFNKLTETCNRVVENMLYSREAFLRQRADRRRDIAEECGHPPTGEITAEIYREMYDRNPIAARVVEVYPRECWQVHPEVYESEDIEEETPFEKAWRELGKSFVSEEGDYFQDQCGSIIWSHLKHADELAGIGRYGVLLLGLADGQTDLSKPVSFRKNTLSGASQDITPPTSTQGSESPQYPFTTLRNDVTLNARRPTVRLAYLRAFPEYLAQVIELENDVRNPRYGQPKKYVLTITDPRYMQPGSVMSGVQTQTMEVHWSRVIHVADTYHTASSSEWFAVPRMRPVFNNLMDSAKLYGGSAEMYWLGAFPGLAFKAIAEEGMAPAVSDPMLRAEIENYMNGLQRFLRLVNIDVEPLSPQVVDPSPQIERQLEAVCVKIAMPKRIFMGSERGELSSSQDDATWNERKLDRQNGWLTPRLIRPFINRLIAIGVLPVPKGYSVKWPDLSSQTATEKADVAFKFAQSISQYTDSQAGHILTPVDFLTKIIGMEEAEAIEVTDRAEEAARKAQEELAAQQEQMAAQQGTDTQSWVQQVAGVQPKGGPPTPPGKNGAPPPPGSTPPGLPGAGPVKPAVKGTLPGKPGVTRQGPGTGVGGGKGKPPFAVRRNANTTNSNPGTFVLNALDGTAYVPLHVVNADQGDGHWVTLEGGQHVFVGGAGGGLKPGGPGGKSVDTGSTGSPASAVSKGGKGGKGSSSKAADKEALKNSVSEKIKSITASGGKASPQDVKELHDSLKKMTVTELNALKKEHGLKASGNKAELVDKLKDRLLEKLSDEKQVKDRTEEAKTTKGAKDQAKRDASDIINRFKEGTQKENDHQELHKALSTMTGKELDALKKEHGLKASGKNKQELADKLKDRLTEKYAQKEQDKNDKVEGKTADKAPDKPPSLADRAEKLVGLMAKDKYAEKGGMLNLSELRKASGMSKKDFDDTVLKLADSGAFSLQRHNNPVMLSQEERDALVRGSHDSHFTGINLRAGYKLEVPPELKSDGKKDKAEGKTADKAPEQKQTEKTPDKLAESIRRSREELFKQPEKNAEEKKPPGPRESTPEEKAFDKALENASNDKPDSRDKHIYRLTKDMSHEQLKGLAQRLGGSGKDPYNEVRDAFIKRHDTMTGANRNRFKGEDLRKMVEKDPSAKLGEFDLTDQQPLSKALASHIKDNAKPIGEVQAHGMATPSHMHEVEVDGVKYKFENGQHEKVARSIQDRVFHQDTPDSLHRATREVIFTSQKNKDDEYHAKRLGMDPQKFKSAATGGDGRTVVYHGRAMSTTVADHESGHNFATKTWGTLTPPPDSEYGKAQKSEKPVTKYGATHPMEDFAEASGMYGNKQGREKLAREFPMKHAALKKLYGD